MGTVELRADKYRVQIRKKGFPAIYKTFDTKEEADLFVAQTESSMENAKKGETFAIPKLPFKVWIDRWRKETRPTRRHANKEEKYLRFWEDQIGNMTASEVQPMQIEHRADQLLKVISRYGTPLSIETRRKYLLMLSSIYNTAIRLWKWAVFNPVSGVNTLRRVDSIKPLTRERLPLVEEFMERFQGIIARKMKEQGLSQRDAASKCGLTLHTFQFATKKGENPTIKNFMKVCIGFGLKVKIEE